MVYLFILFFVAQLAGQIDGTMSNPTLLAQRASSLTSPQPFLPTIGWLLVVLIHRQPPAI
jgi:hypothetical protein